MAMVESHEGDLFARFKRGVVMVVLVFGCGCIAIALAGAYAFVVSMFALARWVLLG